MFSNGQYQKSYSNSLEKKNQLSKNRERAYQYSLEKFKKEYPKQSVKGKQLYLYTYTSYNLTNNQYMLFDFTKLNIGKLIALSEDDYLVVEGTHFNYCNFDDCNIKNIRFRRCSFAGSSFSNVRFDGVIFESCMFSIPVMEDGNGTVDNTYYAPTLFKACTFVGQFLYCDMDNILFEKICFVLTHFKKCNFHNSIFNLCAISSVDIKDCNLCNMSICQTDIMDISFTDEQKSIVNENTFIDYKIQARKSKDKSGITTASGWKADSYDDMLLKKSKSLRNFSRLFEVSNLSDFSGEFFYQSKLLEWKALHGGAKALSTFGIALCGYGERPLFTMLIIIASTFLFALFYMFTGIDAGNSIINYSVLHGTPVSFMTVISDYGNCLFFSVTTFSTVGYGNFVPIGALSMIVSGVHMIVGVSLCALWTGCIFRKIAR